LEDGVCAESDYLSCLGENSGLCHWEIAGCIKPGDSSCGDVWVCTLDCHDDDCFDKCLAKGNVKAYGLWWSLSQCLEDEGYYNCRAAACPGGGEAQGCELESFAACLGGSWQSCQPAANACLAGGPGYLDCESVYTCLSSCPPEQTVCALNCQAAGGSEANLQWQEYSACLHEHGYDGCPSPNDSDCEEAATKTCQPEHETCLGLNTKTDPEPD